MKFLKEQEGTELLSNLEGVKLLILSDLPLINTILKV